MAIFKAICRPVGVARSSGTVSDPQSASSCFPEGVDRAHFSSSMLRIGPVVLLPPGVQDVNNRHRRNRILIFLTIADVCKFE